MKKSAQRKSKSVKAKSIADAGRHMAKREEPGEPLVIDRSSELLIHYPGANASPSRVPTTTYLGKLNLRSGP